MPVGRRRSAAEQAAVSAWSHRTIALRDPVRAQETGAPSGASDAIAASMSGGAPRSSNAVRSERSAIPTVLRQTAVSLVGEPKWAAIQRPSRTTIVAPWRRRTPSSGLAVPLPEACDPGMPSPHPDSRTATTQPLPSIPAVPPPMVSKRPIRAPSTCRCPASPRSCQTSSAACATPVAPNGCPRESSPPDGFTGVEPPRESSPAATAAGAWPSAVRPSVRTELGMRRRPAAARAPRRGRRVRVPARDAPAPQQLRPARARTMAGSGSKSRRLGTDTSTVSLPAHVHMLIGRPRCRPPRQVAWRCAAAPRRVQRHDYPPGRPSVSSSGPRPASRR